MIFTILILACIFNPGLCHVGQTRLDRPGYENGKDSCLQFVLSSKVQTAKMFAICNLEATRNFEIFHTLLWEILCKLKKVFLIIFCSNFFCRRMFYTKNPLDVHQELDVWGMIFSSYFLLGIHNYYQILIQFQFEEVYFSSIQIVWSKNFMSGKLII